MSERKLWMLIAVPVILLITFAIIFRKNNSQRLWERYYIIAIIIEIYTFIMMLFRVAPSMKLPQIFTMIVSVLLIYIITYGLIIANIMIRFNTNENSSIKEWHILILTILLIFAVIYIGFFSSGIIVV